MIKLSFRLQILVLFTRGIQGLCMHKCVQKTCMGQLFSCPCNQQFDRSKYALLHCPLIHETVHIHFIMNLSEWSWWYLWPKTAFKIKNVPGISNCLHECYHRLYQTTTTMKHGLLCPNFGFVIFSPWQWTQFNTSNAWFAVMDGLRKASSADQECSLSKAKVKHDRG